MDTHKVLLDRYLPVPRGVPPEVEYEIENKFGELAASARLRGLLSRLPGETLERYYARQRTIPTTTTKGALLYDYRLGGYKYRPGVDYTVSTVSKNLPWYYLRHKYYGLDDPYYYSYALTDPSLSKAFYRTLSDDHFWRYNYKYPYYRYSDYPYYRYSDYPYYSKALDYPYYSKYYDYPYYSKSLDYPYSRYLDTPYYSKYLDKYYDPLYYSYSSKYYDDPLYRKRYLGEPLYSWRYDPLYRSALTYPSWRTYGSSTVEFPLRHHKAVVPYVKGASSLLALPAPRKESATVEFPLQHYYPGKYISFTRPANRNASRNVYLRSAGILF